MAEQADICCPRKSFALALQSWAYSRFCSDTAGDAYIWGGLVFSSVRAYGEAWAMRVSRSLAFVWLAFCLKARYLARLRPATASLYLMGFFSLAPLGS